MTETAAWVRKHQISVSPTHEISVSQVYSVGAGGSDRSVHIGGNCLYSGSAYRVSSASPSSMAISITSFTRSGEAASS